MNRRMLIVAAGGVAILGALPTQAATLTHVEQTFRGKAEVADDVLGEMRGRYISADRILYFGVEMYTEWSKSGGELVASSALNIVVDNSGNGTPTVQVSNDVHTPDPTNGNGAAISGRSASGSLGQVQGVAQLIQVSGNGNSVANGADVCIGAQCPTLASGLPQTGGNNSISNPLTGATAQVISNGSGVSVSVTTPQGGAHQSISGMTGMQQQAQVTGDALRVTNQLNMVIHVVQPNNAVTAARMSNVLQSVRGL